ncbi:MAG TPA: hypothetical protein VNA14_11690 [Mycobacteriales bacterium]|nr:hypothetical protein [Mycobacteriales bacterium]
MTDAVDREVAPAARLGLLLARADLGYIGAAIGGGVSERALAFLQHGVLVAFEAYEFCSRQLGIDMPDLSWDKTLATAARNTGKFFDDNRRDLGELTADVNALADAMRQSFTVGWRRRLARAVGIQNPDLGVMSVTFVPVHTSVTIAYHAGSRVPGPDPIAQASRAAYDLAQGVGQIAVALGANVAMHRPPATELDGEWSWGDGESPACYAAAFAGDLRVSHVPLMLMLHGAVATAALLAGTDCCSECRVAAFKHRFVVAHHVTRSLVKLRRAGVLEPAATTRVDAMLGEEPVVAVMGMRALRNGLLHLGLSDVPASVFASADPLGAVVAHYAAGRSFGEVRGVTDEAVAGLHAHLTEWLLAAAPGATGFAGVLRPPA